MDDDDDDRLMNFLLQYDGKDEEIVIPDVPPNFYDLSHNIFPPRDVWLIIARHMHWMSIAGLRLQCKQLWKWLGEKWLLRGALKSLNCLHGLIDVTMGTDTSSPQHIPNFMHHSVANVTMGIYNIEAVKRQLFGNNVRMKTVLSRAPDWPGKIYRVLHFPRFDLMDVQEIKVAWRGLMQHFRFHMLRHATKLSGTGSTLESMIQLADEKIGFPIVAYVWPWARQFRAMGSAILDQTSTLWEVERDAIVCGHAHYSAPPSVIAPVEEEEDRITRIIGATTNYPFVPDAGLLMQIEMGQGYRGRDMITWLRHHAEMRCSVFCSGTICLKDCSLRGQSALKRRKVSEQEDDE